MLLITGSNGQLGTELSKLLPDALFADYEVLDITDSDAVANYVKKHKVDAVINCAAYTAVDKAEDEVDQATAVNVDGPRILSQHIPKIIHISTDYVFGVSGDAPITTDYPTEPKSVYGRTKLEGERQVLENAETAIIIRTGWLYSTHGSNFLKTMQRLGAEKESINVVSDQVGTPTYAADLASAIVKILPKIKEGQKDVYHFANEGACSWYDFAVEIMKSSGYNCSVYPISSSEYPTRAERPSYSVLDKSKIKSDFGLEIDHWQEALKRCLKQF